MKLIITVLALLTAALPATASDPLYAALVAGTDAYNAGDRAGCRALYRDALVAVRSTLPAELQAFVADALAREQGEPTDKDAAFLLRRTIDKVRTELKTPSLARGVPGASDTGQPIRPGQAEGPNPSNGTSLCSCTDKTKCACAACTARKGVVSNQLPGVQSGPSEWNAVPKSNVAAAEQPQAQPAPPLIQLPPNKTTSTTCGCQRGGQCLCLEARMACHCSPLHSHVFTSNSYRWAIHADFAALKDAATGEQVGAWVFDAKPPFTPMKDGQWGQPCDLPEGVKPPAAPAKRVSVAAPMRTVQMCAGST